MNTENHFEKMKKMYGRCEINSRFDPFVHIESGKAEVEIPVRTEHMHSGGSLHGSVYFKIMDDAAFFAANSLETTYFVLTSTFTTYLTQAVSRGALKAVAQVVNQTRSQYIVEAVCFNEGEEVARGSGIFIRTKRLLTDVPDYRL